MPHSRLFHISPSSLSPHHGALSHHLLQTPPFLVHQHTLCIHHCLCPVTELSCWWSMNSVVLKSLCPILLLHVPSTGYNLKRTPRNLILNLGKLISNDWDLMLCGRGGENLKTGSFKWHLANHHEDNCLLHGELVWLDAISEKYRFETHMHHWLSNMS